MPYCPLGHSIHWASHQLVNCRSCSSAYCKIDSIIPDFWCPRTFDSLSSASTFCRMRSSSLGSDGVEAVVAGVRARVASMPLVLPWYWSRRALMSSTEFDLGGVGSGVGSAVHSMGCVSSWSTRVDLMIGLGSTGPNQGCKIIPNKHFWKKRNGKPQFGKNVSVWKPHVLWHSQLR